MTLRPFIVALLTTVAAGALAGAVHADPSGRVGRVAYTEGGVSLQTSESEPWTWASRNYPVTPGASFWTGDDGRAQLQIGSVDARLDSQTEVDVLDLDYGEMRLALPQGSVDFRLWTSPRGGVAIATPAGDVQLAGQGLYRIDVGAPRDDGSYPTVEVTVFEGRAEAPSPGGMTPVESGQSAVLYAGYDPRFQDAQDAAIDDWGYDREVAAGGPPRDEDAAAVTGFGDLYAAGDFANDPQYGQVWYPRATPADWAPYRDGHWAYVEPWGYTWIDDQPWGFAPFHYGRWTQIDRRWAWIPGRFNPEPVYAPALVVFMGGVGWNIGGGDAIGWAPLAPDEIYRPGYSVSGDYLRRVNAASVRPTIMGRITINTNLDRPWAATAYRNAGAATVVRADAFRGAQSVRRAAIQVSPDLIAHAPPASMANRPQPTPWARAGTAPRQDTAGRPGANPPPVAARPPAALEAVHEGVTAPPTRTGRPPVIRGARITPPAPRPDTGSVAAPPVMIAPAQIRRPMGPGAASRPGAVGSGSADTSPSSAARDAQRQAAEAALQARQAQAAAARSEEQARQAQAQAARAQARQAADQAGKAADRTGQAKAREARPPQAATPEGVVQPGGPEDKTVRGQAKPGGGKKVKPATPPSADGGPPPVPQP